VGGIGVGASLVFILFDWFVGGCGWAKIGEGVLIFRCSIPAMAVGHFSFIYF